MRAAIEATVMLLDRGPEQHVTLEAIRRRAGVSQGSLTHHFGDRAGLIAAAHVERYVRTCATDREFLGPFDGALEEPQSFVRTMLDMIDEMLSDRRHEVRWVRLTAIAAALGDEQLTSTLSDTYTALTDSLTTIVEKAHTSGILPPDVDARTIALLLTMHAQGLVLDDLVGADVEMSGWNHLQTRFVSTFITPEVAALLAEESRRRHGDLWRAEVLGAGQVPTAMAARLDALRSRAGIDPTARVDATHVRTLLLTALGGSEGPAGRDAERYERLLRATIARLRTRGQKGVVLAELRDEVGLSPQTFHRLIGTREALVHAARVRLEVSRAARTIATFDELNASARGPADMRDAVMQGAVQMEDDVTLRAMWQRIETIAASRTDPDLREDLARVQRVARDLMIEQVCFAQRTGIVDPSLPPTGAARLLETSLFWHVMYALDAKRPAREVWTDMLARIAQLLSPDR